MPPTAKSQHKPRFVIALDDPTYEMLRTRAFNSRRSMQALTRDAIAAYLKRPTRKVNQ
jgi:plasmid stability protein